MTTPELSKAERRIAKANARLVIALTDSLNALSASKLDGATVDSASEKTIAELGAELGKVRRQAEAQLAAKEEQRKQHASDANTVRAELRSLKQAHAVAFVVPQSDYARLANEARALRIERDKLCETLREVEGNLKRQIAGSVEESDMLKRDLKSALDSVDRSVLKQNQARFTLRDEQKKHRKEKQVLSERVERLERKVGRSEARHAAASLRVRSVMKQNAELANMIERKGVNYNYIMSKLHTGASVSMYEHRQGGEVFFRLTASAMRDNEAAARLADYARDQAPRV